MDSANIAGFLSVTHFSVPRNARGTEAAELHIQDPPLFVCEEDGHGFAVPDSLRPLPNVVVDWDVPVPPIFA